MRNAPHEQPTRTTVAEHPSPSRHPPPSHPPLVGESVRHATRESPGTVPTDSSRPPGIHHGPHQRQVGWGSGVLSHRVGRSPIRPLHRLAEPLQDRPDGRFGRGSVGVVPRGRGDRPGIVPLSGTTGVPLSRFSSFAYVSVPYTVRKRTQKGTSKNSMHDSYSPRHAARSRNIHACRGGYGFCDFAQNDGDLILEPRYFEVRKTPGVTAHDVDSARCGWMAEWRPVGAWV